MSNQFIRRKFCEKCGSKTGEATLNTFDKETGEKNTRDICTNQKCVDWCHFYDLHKFSFWQKCKNCGYQNGQYT